MWIRHKCTIFLFSKLEWYVSFQTFRVFKNIFWKKYAAFAAFLYSCNAQIVNFHLCWFYRMYTCIYVYILTFFNKQYAVFVIPKHFVEVLRRWKKVFWVSHFTPTCRANETVPLSQTNNFYNINWIGCNS